MNPVFVLCMAALVLSSVWIMYSDLKERLVSLWILLVFAASTLMSVIYFRGFEILAYNIISVVLYLGFIWLVLKGYLYLKFKKNTTILDEQLGKADVWVILCIGTTFNTVGTVLFFGCGFLFSLIVFVIFSLSRKNQELKTIPLAGLLVFFYLVVIIILNLIPLNLIDCSFVKP